MSVQLLHVILLIENRRDLTVTEGGEKRKMNETRIETWLERVSAVTIKSVNVWMNYNFNNELSVIGCNTIKNA